MWTAGRVRWSTPRFPATRTCNARCSNWRACRNARGFCPRRTSSSSRSCICRQESDPRPSRFSAGSPRKESPRRIFWRLIEVLIDQKELADAESWIRRLEERAPNQYGTVEIRARLLAKQDRYDEAAESLNGFLKKDAGDPKGREIRRRLASARLEEFATESARQGRTEQSQRFLSDCGGLSCGSFRSKESSLTDSRSVSDPARAE